MSVLKSSRIKRTVTIPPRIVRAARSVLIMTSTAFGGLMWSIESDIYQADINPSNSGDELILEHVVYNTTPGSDPVDAMPQITLSGGTNQGVFYAEAPSGWTWLILADTTVYSTAGAGEILPGSSDVFSQYSTSLSHVPQPANAISVGSGSFPTIEADTPIASAALTQGIAGVSVDEGALRVAVTNLAAGITSRLERAETLTGAWSVVTQFVPDAIWTNLTLADTNAPAFFRVTRDHP